MQTRILRPTQFDVDLLRRRAAGISIRIDQLQEDLQYADGMAYTQDKDLIRSLQTEVDSLNRIADFCQHGVTGDLFDD